MNTNIGKVAQASIYDLTNTNTGKVAQVSIYDPTNTNAGKSCASLNLQSDEHKYRKILRKSESEKHNDPKVATISSLQQEKHNGPTSCDDLNLQSENISKGKTNCTSSSYRPKHHKNYASLHLRIEENANRKKILQSEFTIRRTQIPEKAAQV